MAFHSHLVCWLFVGIVSLGTVALGQEELGSSDWATGDDFVSGTEGLEDEESLEDSPTTRVGGKAEATLRHRALNQSSKINPDNRISELNTSKKTVDVSLQLSRYLDNEESFLWLAKINSSRTYEDDARKNDNDDDSMRFDELYLSWTKNEWIVSLGKTRNSWGPALAFNPLNVVVPPRDPLNPDQASEGHPMLFVNYEGPFSADFIVSQDFDREWNGEYNRWGARLSFLVSNVDFGFYFYDGEADKDDVKYNQMVGFSFSSNFIESATIYIESARFLENRRNYYNELGATFQEDENATETVVGSSIAIDGTTLIILEAFHNSTGYTKDQRKNYYQAVDARLNSSSTDHSLLDDYQFGRMNQNYFLLSLNKSQIFDKYSFELQALIAEDGSANSEISGTYEISQNYLLATALTQNSGNETSDFGNNPVATDFSLSISYEF